MFHKDYSNFVRPTSPHPQLDTCKTHPLLNGEEAKRLYLEEVKDVKITETTHFVLNFPKQHVDTRSNRRKRKYDDTDTSDASLFLSAQNNDVDKLKKVLDSYPNKVNALDEFGWSLLMIACQANSIEAVKELLKRGVDTSVRDKAGNSARSLVIKNKNVVLAEILLNATNHECETVNKQKVRLKEEYLCEICNNKVFPDKQDHLSSTIHNINASKGKKIPVSYKIPESNKGYQIMLKVGWDKESGLGRDSCGKKYPVKAIQKLDRKGLGVEKTYSDTSKQNDSTKNINKKKLKQDYYENRRFEMNFRREFY